MPILFRSLALCLIAVLAIEASEPAPGADLPPAEWGVTYVSTGGDTVWVDVILLNVNWNNPCSNSPCALVSVDCHITPCALMTEHGKDCNLDGSTWVHPDTNPRRVGLQAGLTYTLSGGYHFLGFDATCSYERCYYEQIPPDLVYEAPTVAVEPTTWGRIKALYRSP